MIAKLGKFQFKKGKQWVKSASLISIFIDNGGIYFEKGRFAIKVSSYKLMNLTECFLFVVE